MFELFGRIVAFDVGDAWIGVAQTDATRTIVSPVETWRHGDFFEEFAEYLAKNNVITIVVGYPITLKGNVSDQTKKILNFKEKLGEKYKEIPIFFSR
jgi:putative holliday junction resolvase